MTYLDVPASIRLAYQARLSDHGQAALARALAGHRESLSQIPDAVLGAARRSATRIDRLMAQHIDLLRTERPAGSGENEEDELPRNSRPGTHVPREIYTRDSYTSRAPLALYLSACAHEAGVTQVDISQRSGLSASQISCWLTGRSVPDRKSKLISIVEACCADLSRAVSLAEPRILPNRLERWRAS